MIVLSRKSGEDWHMPDAPTDLLYSAINRMVARQRESCEAAKLRRLVWLLAVAVVLQSVWLAALTLGQL